MTTTTKGMWIRASDVKPGWRVDFNQGRIRLSPHPRDLTLPIAGRGSDVRVVCAKIWVGRGGFEIRGKHPGAWIRCTSNHFVWVTSRRRAKAWRK